MFYEIDYDNFWNSINKVGGLRQLAASRGGQLISTSCKNAKSKLEWRCRLGHEWIARCDHIKRGSWCPVCAKNKGLKE